MKLTGPRGVVAADVEVATSLPARMRGLRRRPSMTTDEALILRPCKQVHTFGLPFPIDAVFCDEDMNVLHVSELGPGRMSRFVPKAKLCVELAGGRAQACGIQPGARLALAAERGN